MLKWEKLNLFIIYIMTNSQEINPQNNVVEFPTNKAIEELKRDTLSQVERAITYDKFMSKELSFIRSLVDHITWLNWIKPDKIVTDLNEYRDQYKKQELKDIKDDDDRNDLDMAA